jgi:tetratricopeptide (TPR) repeat protein
MLGRFEEASPIFDKGLNFALEADSVYALGLLEFFHGLILGYAGDGRQAIDHLNKAVRHLEESQSKTVVAFAQAGLGYGLCLMGNLETAKQHLEKGMKILNEIKISAWLSTHFLFSAIVYFETGDLRKAQRHIEEALRLTNENQEKHWSGFSRVWQGRILQRCDRSQVEKAEECILEGLEILEDLDLKPFAGQGYLFLGELCANNGKREEALENLRTAEGMFQEMGMDYWLEKARDIQERL